MKSTITLLFILILSFTAFGAGEVDTTFNASVYRTTGTGVGYYSAMALQPDGKLLIGGSFSVVNGFARRSLVRFNVDGSVDTGFNPPDLFDLFSGQSVGTVYTIAVQSDGKILVGGGFGVSGTSYRSLIRLNSDGSLDSTFNNYAQQFQNAYYVKDIILRSDDSFYVGGFFNLSNGVNSSSGVALLNNNGELNANSRFQINQAVYAIALATNNTVYAAFPSSGVVINRYNSNGTVDTSFTQVSANQQVFKLLLQPDGNLLVGGSFTNLNGFPVSYFGRITPEGAVDTNFRPPLSFGGVLDIGLTPEGKIVVVGAFAGYSNITQVAVIKLNLDGTRDTTFNSPFTNLSFVAGVEVQADGKILISGGGVSVIRTNPNGSLDTSYTAPSIGIGGLVYDIAQQTDGKIIAGGDFNRAGNFPLRSLARYNPDGSVDNTFNQPFSNYEARVHKIALQPDGKILVGGYFRRDTSITAMFRLNSDGTFDTSFIYGGSTNIGETVRDFELLPDGKIIANGTVRLLPNGARDNTYATQTLLGGTVLTTRLQPDGKVLIGGSFTQVGPSLRGRIARLNADGTIDATFAPPQGANNNVNDIELQADGKIIVVGAFTSLNGNNTKSFIGRLNSNGSLDTIFSPTTNNQLFTVKVQQNGKILIGGNMTVVNGVQRNRFARLNPDGNLDPTFTNSTGANGTVYIITLQSDDKILIGGEFTRINNIPAIGIARLLNVFTPMRALYDFDGDRRSDLAVFRPTTGVWYILPSQTNGFYGFPFGQASDQIAPADYDGDGKTDVAVFRDAVPGAGNFAYFYIINSSDGSFRPIQFGATGDVPMAGDWDGDGKGDLAVYRAATSAGGQSFFYYRPSSQPTVNYHTLPLGTMGDKPLFGDFDGDGRLDPAVFRPSTATWIIHKSSINQITQTAFGVSTDIPVPADYDGDGSANIAVFRPSNGTWYTSQNPATNYGAIVFGASGDLPVPADYDGDGRADAAVFRPSNGAWYLNRTTSGFLGVQFGISSDKPAPNAFIR